MEGVGLRQRRARLRGLQMREAAAAAGAMAMAILAGATKGGRWFARSSEEAGKTARLEEMKTTVLGESRLKAALWQARQQRRRPAGNKVAAVDRAGMERWRRKAVL
ncbi:hypothetical protein OPV22_026447 [Ensete ventricosum]|uniref:Uncharacterized protein n=1 Tax=Ensete ventricosum TaxID=4639 RepID=A0AAV8QFU1_ENSVE|nr:hypothetical protein OPV22_026447 [Ensete ventricosum]